MTWLGVSLRILERALAYAGYVMIMRFGNLRGVKVEKYVGKSTCRRTSYRTVGSTGLYVAIGSWRRSLEEYVSRDLKD